MAETRTPPTSNFAAQKTLRRAGTWARSSPMKKPPTYLRRKQRACCGSEAEPALSPLPGCAAIKDVLWLGDAIVLVRRADRRHWRRFPARRVRRLRHDILMPAIGLTQHAGLEAAGLHARARPTKPVPLSRVRSARVCGDFEQVGAVAQ
jgi:hypothetical protein